MVTISQPTKDLLDTLTTFSNNALTCPDDLAVVLETALQQNAESDLADLSFLAKFLHRTYGIMTRIGKDGEGYGRLAEEFGENLQKVVGHLHKLISVASPDVRHRFEREYLAMTPQSLNRLLALMYDLSWYKNWLIDTGNRGGPPLS